MVEIVNPQDAVRAEEVGKVAVYEQIKFQPVAAETCAPEPHVWVAHMRGGEPIHVEICMGCGQINWDGLREQVATLITQARATAVPQSTDHPEAHCHRCGGPNIAWAAPSPLWNEVMRGGDINATDPWNGIICPTCYAVLAERAGIAQQWRLTAERVHVSLQTVTPSGRMWNEQTWLWDDVTPGGQPCSVCETNGMTCLDEMNRTGTRCCYACGLADVHNVAAPEPAATVHGYTAHGHPCCGQANVGSRPASRARCGGVGMCRDCQAAAGRIHGNPTAAS